MERRTEDDIYAASFRPTIDKQEYYSNFIDKMVHIVPEALLY